MAQISKDLTIKKQEDENIFFKNREGSENWYTNVSNNNTILYENINCIWVKTNAFKLVHSKRDGTGSIKFGVPADAVKYSFPKRNKETLRSYGRRFTGNSTPKLPSCDRYVNSSALLSSLKIDCNFTFAFTTRC